MAMSDAERKVVDGTLWEEFCDALKEAGKIIRSEKAPQDPFNQAEGYRYLARLLRGGLEGFLEYRDPLFPQFRCGAHETINYVESDFAKEVRRITEKRGADIVVEHTGAATFAGSLRSLAGGGRIVTCGATSGAEITTDLRPIFFKNLAILGSTMGRRDTLPEILRLAADGVFQAVIDRVLPMEEVAEAHRAIAERAQAGKVLLRIA